MQPEQILFSPLLFQVLLRRLLKIFILWVAFLHCLLPGKFFKNAMADYDPGKQSTILLDVKFSFTKNRNPRLKDLKIHVNWHKSRTCGLYRSIIGRIIGSKAAACQKKREHNSRQYFCHGFCSIFAFGQRFELIFIFLIRQTLRVNFHCMPHFYRIMVQGEHIFQMHHAGRTSSRYCFRAAFDDIIPFSLADFS